MSTPLTDLADRSVGPLAGTGPTVINDGAWLDTSDLSQRVDAARARIGYQHEPALYAALSDAEIDTELELHAWMRGRRRRQRRKAFLAEIASDDRRLRAARRAERRDDAEHAWHHRAAAARQRLTDPQARSAGLHRQAIWSSRALRAVVLVALGFSGVNVGHNLAPAATTGWSWRLQALLGFGIEACVSVPILVIMIQAATAARLGQRIDRTRVLVFEALLLAATVGLNSGRSLATWTAPPTTRWPRSSRWC